MLAPLEGSLSPSSFAKASSHLPTQYTVSCSAASSRSPNNSHLLSISPTRADPGRFIAIKQVDFDPQPSPSTYRIQSGKDCRFSSRSHSQSSNCRVKDCSPSTGSSAFFFLSDPDLLRVSIDSGSELRNSRSRPFGSLVYHWSEQRGDMSSLDQQSSEHRRYTKDTLWEDTNAQSNEEIRYALVEAFRDLQAISLDCHGDCFETQRRCVGWLSHFSGITAQVIDFYHANWLERETMELSLHICSLCLNLEVPHRGIWNACEQLRDILTPERQYDDDYLPEPEFSDVELPHQQDHCAQHVAHGSIRLESTALPNYSRTTNVQQRQGYSSSLKGAGVSASSSTISLRSEVPSEDMIFDCEV